MTDITTVIGPLSHVVIASLASSSDEPLAAVCPRSTGVALKPGVVAVVEVDVTGQRTVLLQMASVVGRRRESLPTSIWLDDPDEFVA